MTGFLAVGLHQLVFHPVFVAPFLLWRLREGQWRIFLNLRGRLRRTHIVVGLLSDASTGAARGLGSRGCEDGIASQFHYGNKSLPLLLQRTPGTTGLMVLNMLRFFAWQNFALLPLLIAGVPFALRERGLPRALLLGILLWLVLITLLLPYQGLGWGFRYLGPYLGSFALLAGFGYRQLEQRLGARADGVVLVLSGVTAVVAMPFLLVTTHGFAEPYLALERLVARQPTPFVVIDTAVSDPADGGWAQHPLDQVRNLPDLSNRPLRFSGNRVNAEMIEQLCDKGTVTPITRADMHSVGFMPNVAERSARFERLVRAVDQERPGCVKAAV